MSRQGKHKEGKVSVGLYIDEDRRALLAYIVDVSGMTATDIIMEGIVSKAQALGIMSNGQILPQHLPAIELIKAAYRTKRKGRGK